MTRPTRVHAAVVHAAVAYELWPIAVGIGVPMDCPYIRRAARAPAGALCAGFGDGRRARG